MKEILKVLGLIIFLLLAPSLARADGAALHEIGNSLVGRAGAGWSASAEDASTAFMNPAGMSRLDRSQWMSGIQPMYINANFETSAGTTTEGGGGGNAGGFLPGGSLTYVHNTSEEWKLGFAVGGLIGLGLDYDDDWAGRYYVDEVTLAALVVAPAVSYQPVDWFAVGVSVGPYIAKLKQTAFINNVTDRIPDGKLEAEDEAVSVFASVGILVEPVKGTRVGVTYYAPAEFEFEDVASVDGAGPLLSAALGANGEIDRKLDLDITTPQIVVVSAHHDVTDDWSLMANVGWQDWSEFGKIDVGIRSVEDVSLTTDAGYRDTWNFALGTAYRFDPDWRASLGFGYASSAVDKENRTPAFPVDRQLRYSGGLEYDLDEDITLGLAYTLVDLGDAEIDQERGPLAGRLVGSYQENWLHIWALSLVWRM